MGFIVQNYVWFIVGGVVVLMAVIGYIAEKTDYVTKKFGEKESKNEEGSTPNSVPAQNETSNVADVSQIDNTLTEKPQTMSNNEYNYDNLNIGLMDSINKINGTASDEIEDPLMNATDSGMNALTQNNEIDNNEDLYAPLNSSTLDEKEDINATGQLEDSNNNPADELYMPQELDTASDSIALESVEPYNLEIQNDENENVDSEDFRKMFPEDPIIIGDKKEETKEENEEVWNN